MCQRLLRTSPRVSCMLNLILIFLSFTASACGQRSVPGPTTMPAPVSPIVVTPEILFNSPIQSPAPTPVVIDSQATAIVLAQLSITQATSLRPDTDKALAVGRLVDADTEAPAPYAWLYLADVIGPDDNPQVLLDISVAPLSITNQDGVFYFQNVQPGKYGIVVWSAVGSALLTEPDSDYSLLFSLQPGEVKNLQTLTSYIP
jgi:hypothetical protein